MTATLTTDRLVLRGWCADDRGPFAAMNADPEVMEHFPDVLAPDRSDALADWFQAQLEERGWGAWAAERRDTGEFIGFIGLNPVRFEADFTPAVEVGWRLARTQWGHGFATEGGRAALDFGLGTLGLDRVVSFTSLPNVRSQAVMRRIGMRLTGEFTHRGVPDGHPLRRHVLYESGPGDSPSP